MNQKLSDKLPAVLNILWVELIIGQAKLQMVSRTVQHLDLDVSVSGDGVRETTRAPGVEVAVGEDDVGEMLEVLVGVTATEGVQRPVELRRHVVRGLALLYV